MKGRMERLETDVDCQAVKIRKEKKSRAAFTFIKVNQICLGFRADNTLAGEESCNGIDACTCVTVMDA